MLFLVNSLCCISVYVYIYVCLFLCECAWLCVYISVCVCVFLCVCVRLYLGLHLLRALLQAGPCVRCPGGELCQLALQALQGPQQALCLQLPLRQIPGHLQPPPEDQGVQTTTTLLTRSGGTDRLAWKLEGDLYLLLTRYNLKCYLLKGPYYSFKCIRNL